MCSDRADTTTLLSPNRVARLLENTSGLNCVEQSTQFLETARTDRSHAALGHPERSRNLAVGWGIGPVEEQGQQHAAAWIERRDGRANLLLLFDAQQQIVGQSCGVR